MINIDSEQILSIIVDYDTITSSTLVDLFSPKKQKQWFGLWRQKSISLLQIDKLLNLLEIDGFLMKQDLPKMKIQHYCITPKGRLAVRSLRIAHILAEI